MQSNCCSLCKVAEFSFARFPRLVRTLSVTSTARTRIPSIALLLSDGLVNERVPLTGLADGGRATSASELSRRENQHRQGQIVLVSITVSPRTDGDRQVRQQVLSDLPQEDSSIRIGARSDGQFIISAVGESHLESARKRIFYEYGVEADVGRPTVIYLQTIRKQAEADGEFIYSHRTQKRFYSKVKLRLEPLEEGSNISSSMKPRKEQFRRTWSSPSGQLSKMQ
jgi:translation elongation factor EF-G